MVSPHIVGTFNFFLHFIFNSDVRFSVTTDAVVRAVTVTFKLGESVEENTVDLRTVSSVFEFDMQTKSLNWTSTDK